MCQPASFIITKDRVYWSKKSDSHEEILREYGLPDCDRNNGLGNPVIARVEVTPQNQDFRLPLEQWSYCLDQDQLPDWYNREDAEKRVREVLPDWLAAKVVLPDQVVETVTEGVLSIYGKVKYICDSAQVEYICDSAQVKNICDSAQVEYICDSAQVKNICDSAQVKYICDSAQVEYIYGSAQVKYIYGSAQVEKVAGKAVVCTYNNLSPEILKSSQAVMIDRSSDTVKCFVGKDE
jgi:hypothetical protein